MSSGGSDPAVGAVLLGRVEIGELLALEVCDSVLSGRDVFVLSPLLLFEELLLALEDVLGLHELSLLLLNLLLSSALDFVDL